MFYLFLYIVPVKWVLFLFTDDQHIAFLIINAEIAAYKRDVGTYRVEWEGDTMALHARCACNEPTLMTSVKGGYSSKTRNVLKQDVADITSYKCFSNVY